MVSLTFYGGVKEIGGNKILLEDRDARLWLDMGSSFHLGEEYFVDFLQPRERLGLRDYFALDLVPKIPGLYSRDALAHVEFPWRTPEYSGILITHVHFDHTNHLRFVDEALPVHMGEGAKTILESWEATTVSADLGAHAYRTFRTGDGFDLDGVEVEPIHVDHSVPGAYGFLLHTSQGVVAYTGDLRRHGPQGRLTDDFIAAAKEARPIAMITEGTRVAPEDVRQNITEAQVKEGGIRLVREVPGKMVLVTFPGRDIDRIRTFSEIAEVTGRKFVVSARTAHLLRALRSDERLQVPDIGGADHLLVYNRGQKPFRWEEDLQDALKDRVVTADVLRKSPGEYIVQLDFWQLAELIDLEPPAGSMYIHSKSEPFDEDDINDEALNHWLARFRLCREQLHASGHLNEAEVEAMIRVVNPQAVYPVHTEHPERFTRFSRQVVQPSRDVPMAIR
ncbi:MAG TPA: MBL fold metallo-hydrolase [Thermoplasmata archaeon]|jgi:ribonuclease J